MFPQCKRHHNLDIVLGKQHSSGNLQECILRLGQHASKSDEGLEGCFNIYWKKHLTDGFGYGLAIWNVYGGTLVISHAYGDAYLERSCICQAVFFPLAFVFVSTINHNISG